MLRSFIILIIFSNIITANDENNKYIDLLPDKEKKAFLDRIARRILEEIKSKQSPNATHVEISDEQLDDQTAFVQEILKEESENLRKKRRNINNENKENNDTKLDLKNEADLNQDRYVDLTLRATDRQKRKSNNISLSNTESTSESNYEAIGVETVSNLSDKNIYMNSSNSGLLYKQNNLLEHVINPSNNDTQTTTVTLNDANSVENNTITVDDLIQTTTATFEIENLIKGYSTTEPALIRKIYVNGNENSDDNNKIPYRSNKIINLTASNSTMQSMNDTKDSKITYLLTTSTKTVNVDSLPTQNNLNNIGVRKNFGSFNTDSGWIDTTETENVSETVLYDIKNSISNGSHVITDKISKNKSANNDGVKSIKKDLHNTSVRNEIYNSSEEHSTTDGGISVSTSSSIPRSTIESRTQSITEELIKLKEVTVKQNVSFRAENAKNLNISQTNDYNNEMDQLTLTPPTKTSLRTSGDFDKEFSIDTSKLKVYDVYEIAPSDTPFVVNSPKPGNDKNPLFVPVYNYDQNNAYINTYTRFGNLQNMKALLAANTIADSKEFVLANNKIYRDISPSLRSRFRNIFYKKASSKKKGIKTTKYNNFQLPKIKFNSILNFNPEDYTDYYLERALRSHHDYKLTDSGDENHPYNLLHKNKFIKNHLQAVRYIMYLNKIYDHVKPINYSSNINFTHPKIKARAFSNGQFSNSQENDKNPRDSIAIDYYFGRQRSNENQNYHETENFDSHALTETPMPYVPQRSSFENPVKDKEMNKRFDNYTFLITVLRDMIKLNYRPLRDYPWLQTTVDIRTGVAKVLDLIHQFNYEQWMHPKDLELLKYVFFLFTYSKQNLDKQNKADQAGADIVMNSLRKKPWFPKKKGRIKRPLQMIKDVYSFIRDLESDVEDQPLMVLQELEDFLNEVTFHLDILHNTLKLIAVTKTYRTQNLYGDLEHVFLRNASGREILQVILHLATYKVLEMVEYSAKNDINSGFVSYVKKNRDFVNNTRDELVFVFNLLEQLRLNVRK